MRVNLDLEATLLNRDHFTDNQTFARKQAKFTKEAPVAGNRKFVSVSQLESGSFLDRNGEFQVELCLSRARSQFEHKFKVNQSLFSSSVSTRMAKFETAYFSFGANDWSLALYPTGRTDSQLGTFPIRKQFW